MKLYCGIDLHSNNHWLTIIDEQDGRLVERRLPNDLSVTLQTLEPYRSTLSVIAVESTFNWYWLVDGLIEAQAMILRAQIATAQSHRCNQGDRTQTRARLLLHSA